MRISTFLITLLLSVSIQAKGLSLIAATGATGHNLPEVSYLTNVTPKINDQGDIAFPVLAAKYDELAQLIFVKDHDAKQVRLSWVMPQYEFTSDVSFAQNGHMMISAHDTGKTVALYDLNYVTNQAEKPFAWDDEIFALSHPYLSASGMLSFRMILEGGPRTIIQMNMNETVLTKTPLFTEAQDGISYVFSPRQAGDYLLIKIRYGKQGDFSEQRPDKLWLVNTKTGRRTLVAQDRDAMPSSTIKSIENMYEVSANGSVAFWTQTDKGRTLFHYFNGQLKRVLTEGVEMSRIDWFSPGINDLGSIVLRGVNNAGKQVIAAYDQQTHAWRDLVVEGDSVELATGHFIIEKRRALTFIGGVDINNRNEVVFNANTLNRESGERVEAIYHIEL